MPRQRLTGQQREQLSAVSMLKKGEYLTIDNRNWSEGQARLIMRAATYPQVQRVFVNPAIKKKLCETWTGDRTFMGKVRPIGGHDSHFHVRLFCPPGVANCKAQPEIQPGDGCGKDLAAWFAPRPARKPTSPMKPPPKPRVVTVGDLPPACQSVLSASSRRGDDNMGMPYAPLEICRLQRRDADHGACGLSGKAGPTAKCCHGCHARRPAGRRNRRRSGAIEPCCRTLDRSSRQGAGAACTPRSLTGAHVARGFSSGRCSCNA